MPKKVLTQRISQRDKQIVKARLEGKTMAQIAAKVDCSEGTVFNTLKRLDPEISEALRVNGLGLNKVVGKLGSLMEQKRTLHFSHQGVVIEERTVADSEIQLRATESVLRLHGAYGDRRKDQPDEPRVGGITIQIALSPAELEESIRAGFNVVPTGHPESMGQLVLDAPTRPKPRMSKTLTTRISPSRRARTTTGCFICSGRKSRSCSSRRAGR
jgi:hypothetical protein